MAMICQTGSQTLLTRLQISSNGIVTFSERSSGISPDYASRSTIPIIAPFSLRGDLRANIGPFATSSSSPFSRYELPHYHYKQHHYRLPSLRHRLPACHRCRLPPLHRCYNFFVLLRIKVAYATQRFAMSV